MKSTALFAFFAGLALAFCLERIAGGRYGWACFNACAFLVHAAVVAFRLRDRPEINSCTITITGSATPETLAADLHASLREASRDDVETVYQGRVGARPENRGVS